MTCVLTTTGELDIYNSFKAEDVFERASDFTEAEAPPADREWPMILPNQWVRFPGQVHQIGNMLNADVTIVANAVRLTDKPDDLDPKTKQVFILADIVKDLSVNVMSLTIRKVAGIDESVKLTSPMGFAVGEKTNKIYAWGISYELPAVVENTNEEVQEDA
mmetsp:Transcript_15187/g.19235  ORF Transcript_15187/g.19235 Transcript_15187/m.19235 type:complete len:161 (+) Transcript_15187:521-1003(+)